MARTINDAIDKYQKVLADIPGKQKQCSDMLWAQIAFNCEEPHADYDREIAELKELEQRTNAEISALSEKSAELESKLADLNSTTSNTTVVMQDINHAIQSAGFQGFLLREKAGAKYVYELVRDLGNGKMEVVDKNLSEGERHFIAFLYFYHMVMGSQSDDGKQTDKIVIIDDPVSSMDSASLFVVASFVREMIAVCQNNYDLSEEVKDDHIRQFFCMTHNPYFFREITYNQLQNYECSAFFEITKKNNASDIRPSEDTDGLAGGRKINRSPVRNTYDSLWETYRKSENSEELMVVIRQILEYYFIQMVGYKNGNLRTKILDENGHLFETTHEDGSVDRTDYATAAAMISLLNVGATGFNDGLYFDAAAVSTEHLRKVFERIFYVMGSGEYYEMMAHRS